jgi:hypothetical protein
MVSQTQSVAYPSPSKKVVWTGVILSALPSALFVLTGLYPFINRAATEPGMLHLGYPPHLVLVICTLEIACAIIYMIPRTSVLGAVLVTGYLGGATASHIRIGESPAMPLIVAALVWLGIYLREPRLHALLPIRR